MKAMRVGLAFDLRTDFESAAQGPEDRLEEYDSESTVNALAEALSALGHEPVRLGGGRKFLQAIQRERIDLVFNIAEGFGTRSREAHVPAVCEMLKIPFTHSDPLTLALSLDKAHAKRIVASYGVPTPRFAVIDGPPESCDLRFPVIGKPLFEGSSIGVRKRSKVHSNAELRELVTQLRADYSEPVLVEEFLSGPEFTVGILGSGSGAGVLGIMEIVPRKVPVSEFVYSLEVKRNYAEEVEYHVPPKRETRVLAAIGDVALKAYRALECKDIARVDIRLDAQGNPGFLEVNPLPGINPVTGDIVIIANRMGVNFHELIRRIVDGASARFGLPGRLH